MAYRAFGEELDPSTSLRAGNTGTGTAPKYSYTGPSTLLRAGPLDISGLMYYGARYYDPALSRFITPDTVYDVGPQGLNRYSYALNNPIIYRDPSGHLAEAAHYALETQYDALPYIDEVDTGNNLADQVLAVGAGIYNLGAMAVNAPFNLYGAVEEGYNAGTKAIIGQEGFSGEGLTTDLAILEASGIPVGSIIEQIRTSGSCLKIKLSTGMIESLDDTKNLAKSVDSVSDTKILSQISKTARVRHHTSNAGLKGIQKEMAIKEARGGGVHVELEPFGSTRPGLYGPRARTGASFEGAYVEFDAPSHLKETFISNYKNTRTAVIPTDQPLNLHNLHPDFVLRSWWKRMLD